ncbi:hypothetical protein TELCIR_05552 [Teladorsagia circumcincta]|uniref:BIG2 domain-containing protein n=1 Tax=Teladorsagia circumcincta TaxID=45464 RepID=A0A2G9US35_TELCI|nr:hypothetical protein TELCIR_05552 [Teladorsagia circumcincta]
MLSCGVTVDQISRIRVETTTKILFVDAAPARMIIEAFNSEGDKFSTLSEIPIDWELSHSGDGRPLRIVPFEQSTYEAPPEIIALENNKKKGYIILVEGVLTGSATLTARFAEPHFANIESHSLELIVVANLLLLPAHDLYLPVHAVVPFQVQIVSVMDILSLTFGDTRKEAEVGSDLVLNVQLMGSGLLGSVPFTDCRAADFRVLSSDNGIFKPVPEAAPTLPVMGTGCSTVTLKAISSGDAKVTVSFGKYEATIDVSAYNPLKVKTDDLALGLESSASIKFEGGPRPWLLDSSAHFSEASSVQHVTSSIFDDVLNVKCGGEDGSSTVILQVGNKPSPSLPLPALSTVEVSVCCARPSRLVISPLNGNKPKCPSNVVKWSTANKSAIKIETMDTEDHSVVIKGKGIIGTVLVAAEIMEQAKIRSRVALRATFDVRLVQPMATEPSKLVLWNEVAALGSVKIVHGSGHFVVHELPGAPFTAFVKGETITVTPQSQGAGSLRIQDVCVGDDFLDVPVKITDIHSLVIYGPQFMEVGSDAEVTIDAVDEAGSSFSRDHGALSNTILEATDANVHLLKYVTSLFLLEVVGGPQPTPQIDFALNNSKVASVEPNALITSKNLGYTSITGTVNVGDGHSTHSTVVLHVVSLAGVRALASTQITETGGRVCIRVNGLDEAETPFAFGGAIYPFKVTWTVSHPGVLKMVHPFGASVSEVEDNRFAICLVGGSAGSAIVKVRVELAAHAKQHFVRSIREFEDSIEVRVEEPLSMRQPKLPVPSIRLAQNTQMHLETAWPQSVVEFTVPPEYSNRLSVTKSGIIKAKSVLGPAAVVVRRIDSPDNETSVVPVTVSAVNSLDVILLTKIEPISASPLQHLPVGVKLDLQVIFRDTRGRQLSASSTPISYRPHRFDLTEIVPADLNRTLTVTMKSPGETVLMVTISGCAGDIVTVSETRQPAGSNAAANKFFLVKLNIKSAALWSDLSEKCSVTIENSVTGQTIHIPVRIRIVGQAAKQVYNALDSAGFTDFVLIFLQHYSWIIPSLMWICALGVTTIALYWFIRRRVWEKEGTFNDTTTLRSPASTSLLSRPSISVQSSPSELLPAITDWKINSNLRRVDDEQYESSSDGSERGSEPMEYRFKELRLMYR